MARHGVVHGYRNRSLFVYIDEAPDGCLPEQVEAVVGRQGLKVSCVEEIAYRMGYIGADELRALAEPMLKNDYGRYLLDLLENRGAIG